MLPQWLVIIPPLLVLVLGYFTRRVMFSLICGIISAALIAAEFVPYQAAATITSHLWDNLELTKLTSIQSFWTCWYSTIFLFLYVLSIYISLIGHAGGAYAYSNLIKSKLHSGRGAEISSMILSLCLFIDDYFSALTVGSVIHPLTDQFKVPRAKLAFLVSSLASSVTILVPLSSFFAYVLGQLHDSGISTLNEKSTLLLADPFYVYLCIIPFILYSFVIISSSWFIVLRGISFGTMREHERIAEQTGNVFGGKIIKGQKVRVAHERNLKSVSFADFLVPVLVLLLCVLGSILFAGGYTLFGGTKTLIEAFKHSNTSVALFLGGLVALIFTLVFYLLRSRVFLKELPGIIGESITLMTPAIITLLLAWTLGDFLKTDLKTGHYLAQLFIGSIPGYIFPVMFFATAFITAFAIGTSWATIAILLPIAMQMLISFLGLQTPITLDQIPLIYPVFGGIFSGAVVGNHLSAISDITIMSATSTGSYHIDSVQTKLEYTLPLLISTAIAYVLSGLLIPYGFYTALFASLGAAIGLSWTLLSIIGWVGKRKRPAAPESHRA